MKLEQERSREKRSGRYRVLTAEAKAKFVEAVGKGNPYRIAVALAGISERTVYRFLALGRKAESGQHRQFWQAVKKAEATFAAKNVELIQNAANASPKFWTASAWLLERRFPNDWSDAKREIRAMAKKLTAMEKQIHDLLAQSLAKAQA